MIKLTTTKIHFYAACLTRRFGVYGMARQGGEGKRSSSESESERIQIDLSRCKSHLQIWGVWYGRVAKRIGQVGAVGVVVARVDQWIKKPDNGIFFTYDILW